MRGAAIVIAASARAVVRCLGMHAENMQRQALGNSMAYGDTDFNSVIDEEGIGHNAAMTTLEQDR